MKNYRYTWIGLSISFIIPILVLIFYSKGISAIALVLMSLDYVINYIPIALAYLAITIAILILLFNLDKKRISNVFDGDKKTVRLELIIFIILILPVAINYFFWAQYYHVYHNGEGSTIAKIAFEKNDSSVCDKVRQEGFMESNNIIEVYNCYQELAIISHNVSYCKGGCASKSGKSGRVGCSSLYDICVSNFARKFPGEI